MNNSYECIDICLKMSIKKRKKLLKFFKNMSLHVQSICLEMQLKKINQLKNAYSSDVITICAFYKSIDDLEVHYVIKKETEIFIEFNIKKLINFFLKQDIIVQTLILKEQKNQFFKNKNNAIEKYLLLSSFYKAINIYFVKFNTKFFKNKTYSLKSQKNITNTNILKDIKEKNSVKKDRFLNYITVFEKLKDEGYSYRKMSLHFSRYYKYDVSHTYIRQMFNRFLKGRV